MNYQKKPHGWMKLSEKPPKKQPASFPAIQNNENVEDSLDGIIDSYKDRHVAADDPKSKRETTRNHVTIVLLWAFVITIGFFALSLCGLCIWGDVERVPLLLDSAKTVIGIMTPIFTFILGFYYATKAAN